MLNFMVNAEGGLTTAGYAICIVLGIVVFGIALFFAGKNSEKNKMSAKQLAPPNLTKNRKIICRSFDINTGNYPRLCFSRK